MVWHFLNHQESIMSVLLSIIMLINLHFMKGCEYKYIYLLVNKGPDLEKYACYVVCSTQGCRLEVSCKKGRFIYFKLIRHGTSLWGPL